MTPAALPRCGVASRTKLRLTQRDLPKSFGKLEGKKSGNEGSPGLWGPPGGATGACGPRAWAGGAGFNWLQLIASMRATDAPAWPTPSFISGRRLAALAAWPPWQA